MSLYELSGASKRIAFTIACVLYFMRLDAQAQEQPRYIFINTWTKWSAGKPSSFNRQIIDEIVNEVDAPKKDEIQLGISFVFDFLRFKLDSVEKSLDNFMKLSQQTNVPILINLDGVNWWEGRPDLWNWWDPDKQGYNSDNRQNVEWTGWEESQAVKICWRNWGSQLRVLPAPNLASPAVLSAHVSAVQRLVPRIVKWYKDLPANRKYLLGGVKIGHETSIGVNAYHYKDGNRYLEQKPEDPGLDPRESYRTHAGFGGGLAVLGYAAVKTAGIKSKGRITREDVEQVVHHYLDTLCQVIYNLRIPRQLIFTHQGDTYDPWDAHLSFSGASNAYSLPGWSFYSVDPATAGDLGDILDRRDVSGWAAVEWWWPGNNKTEWIYNLRRTMSFRDCRFMAIYNWDNSLEKNQDAIAAVREFIRDWKE